MIVRFFVYNITEVWGVPEWLNYKPWNCQKCLTFWVLVAAFLGLGFIFKLTLTMITGLVLAGLNAVAMHYNQKRKTVKIEDIYTVEEKGDIITVNRKDV